MVTSKLDFDRTTGACLALKFAFDRATGACLEDVRNAGVLGGGLRAKRKGEESGLERDLWKSEEDLVWRGTYGTYGSLRKAWSGEGPMEV